MKLDWNWFFSSVAQSAAAIIGIISAFIISKILNKQVDLNAARSELGRLLNSSRRLREKAGYCSFEVYNKEVRERAFHALVRQLENEASVREPEAYVKRMNLSEYDNRVEVIREIKNIVDNYKAGPRDVTGDDSDLDYLGVELLNREKDKIDSLLLESRHNIAQIDQFLERLSDNGRPSILVTFAMVMVLLLFYTAVIYPLSFLPVPSDWKLDSSLGYLFQVATTLKGFLLAAFSFVFTVMLAVFWVTDRRLTLDTKLVQELRNFTELSGYSEYFKNWEINSKA